MTPKGVFVRAGNPLSAAQAAAALEIAQAAAAADGVRPLSEHTLLHLRHGGACVDLIAVSDDAVAGYAHLDPPASHDDGGPREPDAAHDDGAPRDPAASPDSPAHDEDGYASGELVVHPGFRGRGLGRELVRAATAAVNGPVRLWAHGDLPAATALAKAVGWHRARALWQMRMPLREPLDQPAFPAGTILRTFVPGQDEEAWLRLNASAFASHPEQGGWTSQDLALREEEPWFDPAGFFIADRDGTMAGFHWTKVPGIGAAQRADGPAGDDETRVGEVYVVGVDPGQRGTGLGRALTVAGLRHLRASGLEQAMLYVDEENVPAVKMYESLGFTRWRTDAMYADATPAGGQRPAG